MKTVLIILALVVVAVFGLGLYRGWFNVSSHNDESKSNVTLSVDKDKIERDTDNAVDKISPSPEKAQR